MNRISHCISLVALVTLHAPLLAQTHNSNPFGLPTSDDPNRLGTVILHGGGDDIQPEPLLSKFIALAGGKQAKLVVLPTEDDWPAVFEEAKEWQARMRRVWNRTVRLAESGGATIHFLYFDVETRDLDETSYDRLKSATGLLLGESDQITFPKYFTNASDGLTQPTRFQSLMRRIVARGGVVYGYGGGMSCLSESIIARPLETRNGNGPSKALIRQGLGLLRGPLLDQNFSSHLDRLERMTDALRNGPRLDRLANRPGVERKTIGIGLDRHTALLISGSRGTVWVDERHQDDDEVGSAHLFLKRDGDRTLKMVAIRSGQSFSLATSFSEPIRHGAEIDENALGAPEPSPGSAWGTVILHGGYDTSEMFELVPSLAGVASPHIVHCPAARASCQYAPLGQALPTKAQVDSHIRREFSEWLELKTKGIAREVSFLTAGAPVLEHDDRVDILKTAHAVWFSGGDQKHLERLFVKAHGDSPFVAELKKVVRRGGVVGGSSAGLAIMSEHLIRSDTELGKGFGILRNVLAEQHFDTRGQRIDRLVRFLTKLDKTRGRMFGLAVEEDTALIVQRNRLRVTGSKNAHVFFPTGPENHRAMMWHVLHPGDTAILISEGGEPGLHIEETDVQTNGN